LSKINASMTSALVVILGMTAWLLLQHRTLAGLRSDNKGLRRQSEQLARLCADIRAVRPQASALGPTNLAEAVAVDCAVDCGPVSHCGSGFLFGFSDDGLDPPDSAVVSLKIRLHRTKLSLAKAQADRMRRLGFELQVVLSDDWGYGQAHPGDNGDWAPWEEYVRHQVAIAREAGLHVQFDIWNEPDYRLFWQRTPEQFLDTWTRAYHAIRAAEPSAVIVGPSWSNVHPGQPRFDDFLLHCKTNGVVPDYITWHFPNDTVAEVRYCREFCARWAIPIKGIIVNEYCLKQDQCAAATAWHLAQLERARVEGACHAIWGDERNHNLDGILVGGAPRGQWWVYQRYARISGRLLGSTPSPSADLAAVADPKAKKLRMLLGRRGDVGLHLEVRLDHLDALPFLAKQEKVQVQVEQIPDNDGAAVTNLPIVSAQTATVVGGRANFVIPWLALRDAYAVQISPGG
jgi:hypothetical protein